MGLNKLNCVFSIKFIWTWSLLIFLWLRCVYTQDQSYYFPAGNSQNRFVPSNYQNTRQHPYLSSTRNSANSDPFPPQPGSYQEQLLFITNDAKKPSQSQHLTSASYSPFGAQYSQSLRNPDFYDISPRPFGVQLSHGSNLAGLSSSSQSLSAFGQQNSFTRSKAIRPNSLGGFIPQQQLQPQSQRNNVPHQQSQFLAHFNEPSSTSSVVTNSANEKAKTGSTLSTRGGFVPNSGRARQRSSNYNTDAPSTVNSETQKQVSFRNTRNRFQPNNAATTSSTTSTEATSTTSKKRFNRFGATRTTTQKLEPSSTKRTAKKTGGSFQPRRPVFLSREINEPVNTKTKSTKRPFQFPNTNRAKLLKQSAVASSPAATIGAAGTAVAFRNNNNDDSQSKSDEYDDTELETTNQVGNGSSTDPLEKLELHEAIETTEKTSTSTSTEAVKSIQTKPITEVTKEQQTSEIASNHFGKADELASNSSEDANEQASYSDEEEVLPQHDQRLLEEVTTIKTSEYDYEYVEEDESTEVNVAADNVKETPTESTNELTEASNSEIKEKPQNESITTEIPSVDKQETANDPTLTTTTTTEEPKLIKELNETKAVEDHNNSDDDDADNESDLKDSSTPDEYEDEEEGEEDYTDEEGDEEIDEETEAKEEEEEEDDEETTTAKHVENVFGTTSTSMTTTTPSPSQDIIDREIISVVTTKSVVNGSTAFPSPVTPRGTTNSLENQTVFNENKVGPAAVENQAQAAEQPETTATNNSTEGYVVIASIQTSRSINGARFLPFPAIEQEETKQPRSELERKIHGQKSKNNAKVTKVTNHEDDASNESSNELAEATTIIPALEQSTSTTTASSTESIIDKLDRVQSELSSGLLSGKYPILGDMDVSTQSTSTTVGSSKFVPNIRKFQPKTTAAPKVKIHHFDETEMDDLAGLLPAGFKPRSTFKNRKHTTTTTSTTTESSVEAIEEVKKPARNSTIGRSFKNSPVAVQDLNLVGLLPKGYKPSSNVTTETPILADIFSKIKFDDKNLSKLLPKDYKLTAQSSTTPKAVTLIDDISKFLPPGYKLKTTTIKPSVTLIHDDISKFLPPGYKPRAYEKEAEKKETKLASSIIPLKTDEISKFLPPGYKLKEANKPDEDDSADIFKKLKLKEVSSLLPVDYKKNITLSNLPAIHPASTSTTTSTTSTVKPETETKAESTTSASNLKVVFPKGIHKRIGAHRLTTPSAIDSIAHTSPPVVIKKGPPIRATTEFTGWPTPSTTPISIEKLLEQAKTASINFEDLLSSSSSSTTTSTTTTTTTTTPKPTKPGHCKLDCDLAATIKIIDGVAWKPELLDHNTVEWKNLAHEVETELNEVYINAPQLKNWYKKVRIDSFSKGSVLVDYYVELANITQDIDTLEIKKLFHEALTQSPQPILPQKPEIENETDSENTMSDEPEIKEEKLIKETFLMGKYLIDPVATDFSVIPKSLSNNVEYAEQDLLIPHWAIVVIVIGVGSLVFVVIFGVTVLLNRQNRAKKAPIQLTNDMLNELKINHMGGGDNYGVDDFYNIDDAWNDTKQPIKPKRLTNSTHGGSNSSNLYDSWRSTRQGGGVGKGADYFYDTQNIYLSQKGDDTLKRNHNHSHMHQSRSAYPPAAHQYDAFADAHQMYTYNNHGSRSRYPRDYDPDF